MLTITHKCEKPIEVSQIYFFNGEKMVVNQVFESLEDEGGDPTKIKILTLQSDYNNQQFLRRVIHDAKQTRIKKALGKKDDRRMSVS